MFSNVAFGAFEIPVGGGGSEDSSSFSTAYGSVVDYLSNLSNEASDVYSTITNALSPLGSSVMQLASDVSSWTSAKTDEAHSEFQDMVERRKKIYRAIVQMPEGADKEKLLSEFNSVESYVTSALFPLANEFYSLVGYAPVDTTLGIVPVIGLAAVGAALIIGIVWVNKHYDTIAANPALADTGISGGIAKGVTGMLWLLGGVVAIGFALPYIQSLRKKVQS